MYIIRVYGKSRVIPRVHNKQQSHIRLVVGTPLKTNNIKLVEHIRKFHKPEQGRGISIKEIFPAPGSIKSLNMKGMKVLADSVGVEYTDDDSRNTIMKRIKVIQNGSNK